MALRVLSLILGGGRGTRLYPLTQLRCKPAVPIGGKYRLIDIPLSQLHQQRLTRIYVLTQFLSTSLHRHIANTYRFDMFNRGFVEVLAAQQAESVDESVPTDLSRPVRRRSPTGTRAPPTPSAAISAISWKTITPRS